jgi:NADH:ubiquinone oxidoreductase subunit D
MKATYKKKISSWYYDVGCVREEQPPESRKQIREIIKKIDEKIREAKNK